MADEDLELWKKWDSAGRRKKDLGPLLQKFNPMVERLVSIYRRTNIPSPAIRATVQTNLIDSFKSFDPDRGVKLNTHISWGSNRIKRYIATHQNFARIPEPSIYRIAEHQMMEKELTNRLGREPSTTELADELQWPVAHVERMQKSMRKDLSATMFETNPTLARESRWHEVKGLLPYELTPIENRIFQVMFQANKPLTAEEIARKTKLSPSQVIKAKSNIANLIGKYME